MPDKLPNFEKSPLPEREKQVCARLRLARRAAGLTLSAISRSLEISRETLKNYEYGRALVRFDLGQRISQVLNCNQRWLATGLPPMHPHFTIENPLLLILVDSPGFRAQSFTFIYDRVLADRFDERFELLARSYWRMPGEVSPMSREPDLPGIGFGAVVRPNPGMKPNPCSWSTTISGFRLKVFQTRMRPSSPAEYIVCSSPENAISSTRFEWAVRCVGSGRLPTLAPVRSHNSTSSCDAAAKRWLAGLKRSLCGLASEGSGR